MHTGLLGHCSNTYWVGQNNLPLEKFEFSFYKTIYVLVKDERLTYTVLSLSENQDKAVTKRLICIG